MPGQRESAIVIKTTQVLVAPNLQAYFHFVQLLLFSLPPYRLLFT